MVQNKSMSSTAVLKIISLDPDLLTESYHQNYKTEMDSVFKMLKQNHTTNLILDLRDNQGGDFQPARLLLSLSDTPSFPLFDGRKSIPINSTESKSLHGKVIHINERR